LCPGSSRRSRAISSSATSREDRYDADYYRQTYGDGTAPWTEMGWLDRRTAEWIDDFQWTRPARALDLGCGRGRISRLMADRGFTVAGLDYLLKALPEQGHPNRESGSAHYLRGDGLAPPFVDGAFSLVVDYGLFHHVRKSDQPKYRTMLRRLLKPGGRLFISVFHRWDEHANNERRPWVYHRGHYDRFFTRDSLDRQLGSSFERVRSHRHDQEDEHVFLHACYRHRG
jgi:SAM-dependent methyltransferase